MQNFFYLKLKFSLKDDLGHLLEHYNVLKFGRSSKKN